MITDVTGTATTTAAAAAMKKETGMNKDDFLKLFVTQLQNQDPLNPQDSSQFIGQLAQLTQVEQAYNTNTNLQNMLTQGSNSTTIAAVSMIGKQITAAGSQVNLKSVTSTAINYNLASASSLVTVSIKDASGAVVKTLAVGTQPSGNNALNWDGTNDAGAALASGAYTFTVNATDYAGKAVTSTSMVKGLVDGVDMSGATPILSIGNVKVNLTDVTAVGAGV